MTAVATTMISAEETSEDRANYLEDVIRFNIRVLLNARRMPQKALARPLNISESGVSAKITKGHFSLADIVAIAGSLGTSESALMDDSLYKQQITSIKKMGISTVRYLLMPDVCAPARIRTEDPRLKRTLL